MQLNLKTPPASEPVSLDDIKAHSRIDYADDDAELQAMVTAARTHVERFTGRALITQTWTATLSDFPAPSRTIRLPKPPFQEVVAIDYYDADGASQSFTGYSAAALGDIGALWPETSWPATATRPDAVTVEWTAGYGDAADDVPADIREAIMLVAAHFYEHRVAAMPGESAIRRLPFGVLELVDPYRERVFG